MSASSPYGSGATSQIDESKVIEQVKSELQMAFLQEFYENIRNTCFERCISRPGSSLGSGEQKCLSYCFDRYAEATEIVSESILNASGMD